MSSIHNQTKNQCICCGDSSSYIILLHKTRRQTHGLCIECAEGYINPILTKITDNIRNKIPVDKLSIKCPGTYTGIHRNQCKTHIDLRLLQERIPNGSSLYTNILRILLILDNSSTFTICHNIKCRDIVEHNSSYHTACQTCGLTWCKNCLAQPYHEGLNCIEYAIKTSNTIDSKYLDTLKNNGDLKFCPICAVPTIKEKSKEGKDIGCNKIICSSCGIKWCWLCNKTNIDYDHFNSKAGTPCANKLWLGVDIQNQI